MADKGGRSTAEERDESFDALLQQLARVSGSAQRARAQFSVGATLAGGRFQILRQIGEGGMGLVYEARDEQRRSNVALKTLARLDASSVYRLKNEFRSLADVSHHNLVRLHELFGEAGESEHWFFTMELVAGERFDDWVRPAAELDEARLRSALPQLSAGIAAIHAAGKLHRDLKPSNVLVTRDGRVVVLDFGLVIDPEAGGVGQTLRDESVSGTPGYMAPEQAAGLPATTASDMYALGVMLYEALTGALPFEGRPHEMLVDKQRRDAPSAGDRTRSNAGISALPRPTDLVALCDALLARDPVARPDHESFALRAGEFRVIAARPEAAARNPGPPARDVLLGRDHELAQLRDAYAASRRGKPSVVFVAGESGIGKSALCQTFLDSLRAEAHAVVLAGRCHERESVPFKGLDSLVDDLSRFLRRLPLAEASALMPREVYALARIFPALGRIDAVAQAPRKDLVDPQELRLRAFAAFCELLARIRDRRPLVLHIDDAQWLDRDAVTFLGYLFAQYEPPAALLLFSHRSEDAAGQALTQVRQQLQQHARFERRELTLEPLAPAAARALATRLLGADHAALASSVAAESSGRPFFVEELSRLARRSTAEAGPTLQQAVLARVAGLSAGVRNLLEVLAVAGGPLAAELALEAAHASHEQFDALHAEHLARRSGSGPELEFECYHDKIRESVVHVLSGTRLRALHAGVFAALRARQHAEVEQLALHAQGAGEFEAAAHYLAVAAARASESMAFDHAATLYARALELGTHAEPDKRELHTKLGEALANAGRGADAARAYLDAAAHAVEDDALELKRRAAEQLLLSGRIHEGRQLLDEVLRAVGLQLPNATGAALFSSFGWERVRRRLRQPSLASYRVHAGVLPEKQRRELVLLWTAARGLHAFDDRYVRLALDSGWPDHAAQALGSQAWFVCVRNDMTAQPHVESLGARAAALALASDSPTTIAWVEMIRGATACVYGDYQLCWQRSTQAIETLREHCTGVAYELASAQMNAHTASVFIGNFASAAVIAASIEEATRRGDVFAATVLTSSSTAARLVQGDVAGALRHIEQARQHWPKRRGYAWAHFLLLAADILHAAYVGDDQRGLSRLQADWAMLEKQGFLLSPLNQTLLRAFRGGTALRRARRQGPDAAGLRALGERDARALDRVRAPTALGFGQLLRAGLALAEGQHERAVERLRSALTRLEHAGALTFAAGARRRLGQLLGTDEGTDLVAQADSALRAMGAVDLEATTRVFTFGLDLT